MRIKRLLFEWVPIVVVAVGAAVAINHFVISSYYIPSGSMKPTLQVGDRIVVNKLSYDAHPIHRDDIVVFATPPADTGDPTIKDLVKRVIGLPGEVISSSGGHVLINAHVLSEPYLPAGTVTDGIRPTRIPPNEYYVMGDNRTDSKDSRFFGPIHGSLVVGRAVLRFWPLSQIGLL
jgi:signal peptidase I